MRKNCMVCKHFVQHYYINPCFGLSYIHKDGHCAQGMIKDNKLKVCKDWTLVDLTHKRNKQKEKLESAINKIHAELDQLLQVYNALNNSPHA